MAAHPSRIGYLYRYAQGRQAASTQAVPPDLSPDDRAAWVRGWQAADQDHAAGRPARIRPPEPAPEAPPAPEPPMPAPQEPRMVKARVAPAEAPPAAPAVVLANRAPPPERPPPWLLLRVHRDEWGFRVESEGSDATLPGNSVAALTQAIDVHVRLRLGPDDEVW